MASSVQRRKGLAPFVHPDRILNLTGYLRDQSQDLTAQNLDMRRTSETAPARSEGLIRSSCFHKALLPSLSAAPRSLPASLHYFYLHSLFLQSLVDTFSSFVRPKCLAHILSSLWSGSYAFHILFAKKVVTYGRPYSPIASETSRSFIYRWRYRLAALFP